MTNAFIFFGGVVVLFAIVALLDRWGARKDRQQHLR